MKMMRWFKNLLAVVLMALMAACGGGGGSAGTSVFGGGGTTGDGTTATPIVTLALSKDVVTTATTITATATVTTTAGALAGANVKFSLSKSLATLSSDTATTNSQGVATIVLSVQPGQNYGADTLTAAVVANGSTATANALFTANSATALEVLANSNSVPSAGDQVSVTVIVKGVGNVGLAGAPVIFTSDSGTLLSPSSATDATGVATVKLNVGADKSNRTIKVTAKSGSAEGQLAIPVEGTKLAVSGATTMSLTTSNTLSVKATDSSGKGISGAVIAAASVLGNKLSSVSITTDSNGLATLTYTAVNAGQDTVNFSGLGTNATTGVAVSAEDFSFVTPAARAEIAVGASQTVQVLYRKNGVGVVGQVVNFSSTGGTLTSSTATTDSTGTASIGVSSISAAPATIQAQVANSTALATLPVFFVAKIPAKLVLQVTPTAIGPNIGGGITNQAQVVAKVTDANANPVPGVTVNFSRDADPSGGNYLQPSGLTDINGVATVQYASGAQSTANDAVILSATVSGYPSVDNFPPARLTVSQSALFIALGTGNTIANIDPQTYKKQWTVYVTDANGVAVSNVAITAKVLPLTYRKGSMVWSDVVGSWVVGLWDGVTVTLDAEGMAILPSGSYISCANEDLNLNGVLDPGEDVNNSKFLEPGNVIALEAGNVKTDASGRATLSLVYAESYVPWVEVSLAVQAVVSGTASKTTATFVVVGSTDDLNTKTTSPAGRNSPYGQRTHCIDPK